MWALESLKVRISSQSAPALGRASDYRRLHAKWMALNSQSAPALGRASDFLITQNKRAGTVLAIRARPGEGERLVSTEKALIVVTSQSAPALGRARDTFHVKHNNAWYDSQSAPALGRASDPLFGGAMRSGRARNPRSPWGGRATTPGRTDRHPLRLAIRARPGEGERPIVCAVWLAHCGSQSAPALGRASDRCTASRAILTASRNPRPPWGGRATVGRMRSHH